MGSLAGADPTAHERSPGTRCAIAALYDQLDPDDAAALRGWLDDDAYTTAAIARTLADHGHKLSHSTLSRHRNAGCKCEQ